MSAWKTHPVGRARGAGLAGPPGPGLQPHGDRAGKQVPTPNTHIVGGLLEPGTPASHPCPGKHTPQPLSAHLWEWRCGATLTPERTQPETTMHTHSAPACARIICCPEAPLLNPTDPGHPLYSSLGPADSWLHHLGPHLGPHVGDSFPGGDLSSRLPCWKAPGLHTSQTGSLERRPLSPAVTRDNIWQPTRP